MIFFKTELYKLYGLIDVDNLKFLIGRSLRIDKNDYFHLEIGSSIGNSGQYVGGVLVMQKNKHLLLNKESKKKITKFAISSTGISRIYISVNLPSNYIARHLHLPKFICYPHQVSSRYIFV